jgi:hypothetical protein
VRYKVWRSNQDKHLHLVCREGGEAFEALPASIRGLGPWQGSREGDIADLRLPLRLLLTEQAFVLVHEHVSKLELEARRATQSVVDNRPCPDCDGTGNVPQHGGLRQKNEALTTDRCNSCSTLGRDSARSVISRPRHKGGLH